MPPRASLKLVVDTNIWISYLITRSFVWLNDLIDTPRFRLLYSEAMIDELASVLDRPRIAKQISSEDMMRLFSSIQNKGARVEVVSEVHVCRDPDDDKVLALCKDGRADLLLTGDKDLLVLSRFGPTRILPPAQFMAKYR